MKFWETAKAGDRLLVYRIRIIRLANKSCTSHWAAVRLKCRARITSRVVWGLLSKTNLGLFSWSASKETRSLSDGPKSLKASI